MPPDRRCVEQRPGRHRFCELQFPGSPIRGWFGWFATSPRAATGTTHQGRSSERRGRGDPVTTRHQVARKGRRSRPGLVTSAASRSGLTLVVAGRGSSVRGAPRTRARWRRRGVLRTRSGRHGRTRVAGRALFQISSSSDETTRLEDDTQSRSTGVQASFEAAGFPCFLPPRRDSPTGPLWESRLLPRLRPTPARDVDVAARSSGHARSLALRSGAQGAGPLPQPGDRPGRDRDREGGARQLPHPPPPVGLKVPGLARRAPSTESRW
jgi:hypothetical protein